MRWKIRDEKIVGYVLLAVGVILIMFSIHSMLRVFTGGSPPPDMFHFSDISLPVEGGVSISLISGKELNKLAGMGVWFILMFFIMWAGGKIGYLGVNLIREIKVEVKGSLKKMTEEGEEQKTEMEKKA